MWPRLITTIVDLLFPPLCHQCKAFIPGAGKVHLCAACRATSRPIVSPFCPVCGLPLSTDGGSDHPCGICSIRPRPFKAARAAAIYEGTIRDLIHRLKYDGRVQSRCPLGLLMAEALAVFVADAEPDLLVPVPLHVKRIRERGFNQAILLGEVLAREWNLPLKRTVLVRTRWTEPQVNLVANERQSNVRGAFEVSGPSVLEGKRIMLVDDVLTTGSTVSECSRVLKQAGAGEVYVVTAARVAIHGN